jgi:endonuclease-3 related protein
VDNQEIGQLLKEVYHRLLDCYGPQNWWPADESFEIMVGAVLTQSAAWVNVEKAIANLKRAKALSPGILRRLSLSEIARLIRPSGYYNVKARKLQSLAQWVGDIYDDNIKRLCTVPTSELRQQLLSVYGVGKETADSILLYVANKPVFVIDAYTQRITSRIGVAPDSNSYAAYQSLFMNNLPCDVPLFNEYHALLVRHSKNTCRKNPLCHNCCLLIRCQFGKRVVR